MGTEQTPTVPDRSRNSSPAPGVIRPVATGRQRVLASGIDAAIQRMVHGRRPGSEQEPIPARPSIISSRGACRLGQQHAHPGGQEQQGDHLWFGQLDNNRAPGGGQSASARPLPFMSGS